MQTELNQAGYSGKIALFSINNKNKSNPQFVAGYCEGKTIPYLQDTNAENVYGSWNASKDEIVLLDKQGNFAKVIDLKSNKLTQQANYDNLVADLKAIADAP